MTVFAAACLMVTSCSKDEMQECLVEVNGEFVLMSVTKMPEYIDGQDSLNARLAKEVKYPAEAREKGIEGTVILDYVISSMGTVDTVIIAEDIGGGCGEASKDALIAVTPGTSFYPAEIDQMVVTVKKRVPIRFKLE